MDTSQGKYFGIRLDRSEPTKLKLEWFVEERIVHTETVPWNADFMLAATFGNSCKIQLCPFNPKVLGKQAAVVNSDSEDDDDDDDEDEDEEDDDDDDEEDVGLISKKRLMSRIPEDISAPAQIDASNESSARRLLLNPSNTEDWQSNGSEPHMGMPALFVDDLTAHGCYFACCCW